MHSRRRSTKASRRCSAAQRASSTCASPPSTDAPYRRRSCATSPTSVDRRSRPLAEPDRASTRYELPSRRAHYYGGAWQSGEGEIAVTSPSTGERLGVVPNATVADVDRAVAAARAGFAIWRDTPAQIGRASCRERVEGAGW